jgi:cob(I)alamin adenosyltransferase
MGDVDEMNSHLGLLLCEDLPTGLREELVTIQHDLFDLGGELCIPGYTLIKDEQVARLDALLAHYNAGLPPLADFILPAGSRAACQAHVCRTVCRRAERAIVALGKAETLNDHPRQYMNRLSDLMFVLARVLNRHAGGGDVLWEKGRGRA